jgi:hypothetical protein
MTSIGAQQQPRASTVPWTPPSKTRAAHPNIAHTARYPAVKQASSRPRRPCPADVSTNSRSSGRAEGSIMAVTITVQARA